MTEEALINGLLKGEESAFKTVVDTYKNKVYNTVLGLLQDVDDAEDITQEVFIKVYENIARFKGEAKLGTWIYRIAITQATDLIRRRNRKKRGGFILSLFGMNNEVVYEPPDFLHPGVLAEDKERSVILFRAINKLPDAQKTAFILQKLEDKSQREIAEIMDLKEGAVESLLSRAKANLKKMLTTYYHSI